MSDKNRHNSRTLRAVETANIDWAGNFPRSKTFSDIYFSSTDSYKETQHVFIEANNLSQRWAQLDDDSSFTIIETGFGTGLNFLATAHLWLEQEPEQGLLQFTSIEKFPLTRLDMITALAAWPKLSVLSAQLADQYPPPIPGFHRIYLTDANNRPRIALTLIFDDAEQALKQLRLSDHPNLKQHRQFSVDAWFLDGFAPGKNPGMWTSELFQAMADLSDGQTTFSTFSAAGLVRRGLQEAGFEVTKVPGYGSKRHMLIGKLAIRDISANIAGAAITDDHKHKADFAPRWPVDASRNAARFPDTDSGKTARVSSRIASGGTPHKNPDAKQVAIIGGGIAGCTTAQALAQRGWQVTIYEKASQLAAGASGNPQGIIYPRLSLEASFLSRFNLTALLFATRYYKPFWSPASADRCSSVGKPCGILILPENDSDRAVFAKIAANFNSCSQFVSLLNRDQIRAISGVKLQAESALYFPSLGWIEPQTVCEQLTRHNNIRVEQANIMDLSRDTDNDNWLLKTSNPAYSYSANTVVIAAGYQSKDFDFSKHLPLKAIRGQISIVQATPASQALRTVLCGAGYLSPASNGLHTFGATYNLDTTTEQTRDSDHLLNLENQKLTDPSLPDLLGRPPASGLSGRASLRCTTPDYLPVVGPAPQFKNFLKDFSPLRKDARADIPLPGSYWPGLYLHCGLGSRGFSYAPLGAKLLACLIEQEVPPLPRDLQMALHPARFIIRDLKRKRI